MICETCAGSQFPGWIIIKTNQRGNHTVRKCPDCINGTASCCGDVCAQPEPASKEKRDE